MKRLITYLLVPGLLGGSVLLVLAPGAIGAAAKQSPNQTYNKEYDGFQRWVLRYGVATSDTVSPGYVQANRAFEEALAERDAKAVGALLNDNFQWVEWNGVAHSKLQIVSDPAVLDAFAKNNEGAMDVRTTDFRGDVERILGMHHDMRFANLWAKGSAGWQAFAFLDIPIPRSRKVDVDPPSPPKNPDAPCPNPCGTVGSFRPADAAQAGVLNTWMALKNAEWHPNPESWSSHADIYHETISPGGDLPMLQHVAQLSNARRLYGPDGAGPGEPVIAMRMYTFGDVVIQEDLQGSVPAKPATWIMRVFVNRGNEVSGPGSAWKICLSAQTRITENMAPEQLKKYMQSLARVPSH